MMISILGEDYITLAEAKGLSQRHIFLWYALRNALLPQMTKLALTLGHIVSGAILVEVIFAYPGIGTVLYHAIRLVCQSLFPISALTIAVRSSPASHGQGTTRCLHQLNVVVLQRDRADAPAGRSR